MDSSLENQNEKEVGFPWGTALWGLAAAALVVASLPAVAPTLGIGLIGSWACIAGAAISGFLSFSSFSSYQEEKAQQEYRMEQIEQQRSQSQAISQSRGQTYEASYDAPSKQWATDPSVQCNKCDIHEMTNKPHEKSLGKGIDAIIDVTKKTAQSIQDNIDKSANSGRTI